MAEAVLPIVARPLAEGTEHSGLGDAQRPAAA